MLNFVIIITRNEDINYDRQNIIEVLNYRNKFNMAKSIDSIKKMTADDIKKSREIVLNYIKEQEENLNPKDKAKTKGTNLSLVRSVDGIIGKMKIGESKINKKDFRREESLKESTGKKIKAKRVEENKKREEIKKQEELRKKEEEERKMAEEKRHQLERIKAEKQKKKAEEAKVKELMKKLDEEKTKKEETEKLQQLQKEKEIRERAYRAEIRRKEKIRKEEERLEEARERGEELLKLQRLEERRKEEDRKKRLKEERKLDRAKRINLFKKRFKEIFFSFIEKLNKPFIEASKILKYTLPIIFVSLIIGYFFLLLILSSYGVSYNFSKKISNLIFLPVFITKIGAIEFYEYQDVVNILKQSCGENCPKDENIIKSRAKEILINNLIIRNLAIAYNIDFLNNEIEDEYNKISKTGVNKEVFIKYFIKPKVLKEKIMYQMAYDKKINEYSLMRIEKIYNLFNKGKNFDELKNLSDGSANISYINNDQIIAKFGQSLDNLKIGEISNVIIRQEGYYLVQKYSEDNGAIDIKYIFVKAKSIDDYINEKLKEIKVLSFID